MRIDKQEVSRKDMRLVWTCVTFPMVMAMTIIPSWFVRAIIGMAWMIFMIESIIYLCFPKGEDTTLV